MTPDYLPKTWIKSVATECGISCETIEQLLDFAERVQRAAWLAKAELEQLEAMTAPAPQRQEDAR
jgi:hypothetical protein